jgi:hypothetical protein
MEKKSTINAYRFIKPLLYLHIDNPCVYALLTFLCHAAKNETGKSYHGQASIKYTTGMAEKTIRKATKRLAELGVISCQIRGWQKANLYTVHYDQLLALAETSRAGRDEYMLTEQGRKAARQQRWRHPEQDSQKGISPHQSEAVKAPERDGQNAPSETVNTSSVRQPKERPNYVRELGKVTKEKELDQKQISGTRDFHSRENAEVVAAEDIQKLEREVSDLHSLKQKAISEGHPVEYNRLNKQLQESQAKLNIAHGALFRAAVCGQSGSADTSPTANS